MSDWLDIHSYVEGQLDAAETARIAEELKSSEQLQAEYRAVTELKALLNDKCASIHCQETWERSRKRLDEIDRTKRVEHFVGKYAWGLCSLFLFVIMSAAMFNRSAGAGIRTGDVASMASSLSPVGAPRSQARDERERWLRGLVDPADIPVQSNDQVAVVNGAVGNLNGRRVVRLDLQDSQGEMSMFIVSQVDHVEDVQQLQDHGEYSGGRINDMNCLCWTDNGNAFLMVGNRSLDELAKVANTMYNH